MGDSFHIFLCFCRKAKHKIKFYLVPSALKCFSCTVKNHFLCQTFVDNITQTLGACFRCESKAALLYILYLAHNIQGKGIDTQGWQRDIDSIAMKFFDQEVYQFLQLRVITGA